MTKFGVLRLLENKTIIWFFDPPNIPETYV